MKRILSLALAGALLAGGASTQTVLTGLGEVPCLTPTLGLASQKVCRKPTWCMTKFKPNSALWAGATTWDAKLGAAWVSNGSTYGVVYPSSCQNPCKCVCKTLCVKMWPIKNYITGMAMNSAKRILFISDSNNAIRTFYAGKPCEIKQIRSCSIRLPSHVYITGLAYDQVHDYLFYVASDFNPFTPPATILYVAKASSPCNPFCKWPIIKCPNGPFGPATGLAYDPSTMTVFVTDAKGKTAVVKWDGKCGFKLVSCCPASPVKRYYGLGLRTAACSPYFGTAGKTTRASMPCPNQECQTCDPVPGYAGGPPQVGNLNFRLTMIKGPNPRKYRHFVFLMLNLGNHCRIQALNFPCGPIWLYPVPDSWFYSTLVPSMGGVLKCSLSAQFHLPIPLNPALRCYKFCGQWAVFNLRIGKLPLPWCLTATKEFSVKIGG